MTFRLFEPPANHRTALLWFVGHGLAWVAVIRGVGLLAGELSGIDFEPMAVDHLIPFVPEAFWGYILLYPFPLLLLLPKTRAVWGRYVIAMWITTLVCCALYLLWPIRIPYPETPDTLTGRLLAGLYSLDFQVPANKFPSGHAAMPVLICLALGAGYPLRRVWPAWGLAAVVAASAVLVKQHVFIDIVAGVGLAFVAWWLARFIRFATSGLRVQ